MGEDGTNPFFNLKIIRLRSAHRINAAAEEFIFFLIHF